jgi:predicted acyltransferase
MECVEFYSNALQAIAVGYLVTALALLHLRLRGQIGLFVAILLGYGALLMFVPFPDHPGGTLQRTANLPRYIDELLLGDYRRDHSFTWLLTSLGFAASVLLGAMAGHILNGQRTARRKLLALCTIGSGCMAMGWLWSYWLPFNRHLWSSSMVLWAGGIGFLLVALFYAVMDVGGWRRWAFPLVVIGSNALLAYVLDPIYHHAGDTLASCLIVDSTAAHHGLLVSLFEVASLWLMLLFLYRRRVFFRA